MATILEIPFWICHICLIEFLQTFHELDWTKHYIVEFCEKTYETGEPV